jgi:two-component system, LuxR family, response regulator FixJ
MSTSPKLYVVDDDRGTRSLIVDLFASVDQTCEPCGTAQEFLSRHDPATAAILILDVRLPDMSGLELLERMRVFEGRVATIMITGFADVEMAVRALKLGAVEFVEKPFRAQDMLDKVQRAREQLTEAWSANQRKLEVEDRLATLSPREAEVLDLVVAGHANKIIADRLQLSQKTIEFHRAHLMRKMEAETVVDLVRQVFVARGF